MENKNFTQSMIIPIEKRKMDVGFGSKSQLKIDEKWKKKTFWDISIFYLK